MKFVDFKDVPNLELSYPLFFQESFAKYESTKGWTLKLFTDGKAYLPVKTKAGKFIKQAQYLFPPVSNGSRLTEEAEKTFLENFKSFCKKENICDFIIPPMHYSLFNSVPKESYYTDLGIIVVDLQKSEEELFKAFSSNYRNEVRKAQAENLQVQFDNSQFSPFYSLYKSTHQKQGIYFDPEMELKNLIESLGEKNCRIAVVRKGNEIYGASLVLFNADEAYYFQSGAIVNCPHPGANKLLQLEIMKWLKLQSVKRYVMGGYRLGDVSGTKYDGIQKFKMRFGAEVEKGFHFYTEVTWRYRIYKNILKWYLKLRGVKQNTTGLNYRYK